MQVTPYAKLRFSNKRQGVGMSAKLDALDAKIAAQTERLRQLKEQKSKAERRAEGGSAEAGTHRDTRRKILLGRCGWKSSKGDTAVLEKTRRNWTRS